ncbi:DUF2846 domain-containing protein [Polaromonas sp. CF318]|uniref:DUF2846 domain-containing protein n=1 Tax=Polaromonas sp. CF318 TaxID=1144318 RepID=UPI00056CD97A|nr:DUF2846 domain-containing protein [Polaromonas sp. CF318]
MKLQWFGATARKFLLLCLLGTCALLQGCAIAMGNKFTEMQPQEPDFAHIYFLRIEGGKTISDSRRDRTGAFPDISVNGQNVGSLKRGGYLFVKVPPGQISIKTLDTPTWWPAPMLSRELKAEKRTRYFYLLSSSDGGLVNPKAGSGNWIVNLSFERISEAEAVPILKGLQLP